MPTLLITGASRGIGRATALRMDARGWDVLAGVRSEEAGEALRANATERLKTVVLDITDADSVAAAAATVGDRQLDALVNNAGVALGGLIEAQPIDEVRRQLEINVVGQIAVTQALLPALRLAQGRVVFTGSVSGRVATPFTAAYSASKAAIASYAEALRFELREWGMHVVLIEPGAIATDMWGTAEAEKDAAVAAMSDEHRHLYRRLLGGLDRVVVRMVKVAEPVDNVADAMERALTDTKPKTSYVVGREARVQAALARVAPARLMDAGKARMFGV